MQIRRYDGEIHNYAPPRLVQRTNEQRAGATEDSSSSALRNAPSANMESKDTRWAEFAGLLQNIPASRPDVVQAAKDKVAFGEFTTREAALKLAATDLRNEIF